MAKRILCLLIVIGWFSSCDDTYQSNIPYAKVSFSCNLLQDPFYIVTTVGQFFTVKPGVNGYVISVPGQVDKTRSEYGIYLGYGGLAVGQSTFNGYCAFDLTCPVEADSKVTVKLQAGGLGQAICPKCQTVYNLNNGGIPEKGVSKERLKPYRASLAGSDKLVVTN